MTELEQPLSDRFCKLFFSIASSIRNESSFPMLTTDRTPDRVDAQNLTSARSWDMENENDSELKVPSWVYGLMTALYVCIFALGITGNLLVILVIAKDRRMRTTANFYLISLSLADLMIIVFCLPVAVYELHAEEVWKLGPVLCKLASLLQYLSTNASISTMVAISCERYLVVCRPLKIRTYCTKGRACGLLVALWLFSLACSSPVLYFTKHESYAHPKLKRTVYVCYINHYSNEAYFYFHQICFYILPGLLLSFLYSRIVLALRRFKSERFGHSPDSRKNAGPGSKCQSDTSQLIFMLSVVVLSYFVCLLPYNCITFLSMVSNQTLINLGPVGYNVFLAFSRIMFFVNSCSNPITYNALSAKFRDAFRRFFCPGRAKRGGMDSRTLSVRSARGVTGAGDEEHRLIRRYRSGPDALRIECGSSTKTIRMLTASPSVSTKGSTGNSRECGVERWSGNSRPTRHGSFRSENRYFGNMKKRSAYSDDIPAFLGRARNGGEAKL